MTRSWKGSSAGAETHGKAIRRVWGRRWREDVEECKSAEMERDGGAFVFCRLVTFVRARGWAGARGDAKGGGGAW